MSSCHAHELKVSAHLAAKKFLVSHSRPAAQQRQSSRPSILVRIFSPTTSTSTTAPHYTETQHPLCPNLSGSSISRSHHSHVHLIMSVTAAAAAAALPIADPAPSAAALNKRKRKREKEKANKKTKAEVEENKQAKDTAGEDVVMDDAPAAPGTSDEKPTTTTTTTAQDLASKGPKRPRGGKKVAKKKAALAAAAAAAGGDGTEKPATVGASKAKGGEPKKPLVETLDRDMAMMEPRLAADYFVQRLKRFDKDLSSVEVEDKRIPGTWGFFGLHDLLCGLVVEGGKRTHLELDSVIGNYWTVC